MVPKFRGRNIETGECVYGHLFYFNDGRHFISPTGTDVIGGYGGAPAKYRLENLVCFEINPKTLGQSTGLKDKNGVAIFEGDIVWIIDEGELDNGWGWSEEVIFHNGSFMAGDDNLLANVNHRCVVSGNKYEREELLEPANEN